jgi:uncharacterized membrane protein
MEVILVLVVLACVFQIRSLFKRVGTLERQVLSLRGKVTELASSEPTANSKAKSKKTKASADGADVEEIDKPLPIAATTMAADVVSEPVPDVAEPQSPKAAPRENSIWKAAAEKQTADESARPAEPAKPKQSFEDALGARWAIWVGGLAFALGGIFLVRYSIESGFFSPALRVSMATLFGLGALGAGEFLRRRDIRLDFAGDRAAQVPAILTAAGAAILFAAVYVAYGVYGMIGATTAFALLALISLGVIALGLFHGSVLAGLGLIGSFITPALVSSQSPNVWTFFTYLGVVLAASGTFAKFRRVEWILAAAIAGTGFWTLLECWHTMASHPTATLFAVVLMLGAAALFWVSEGGEGQTPNEKLFPKLPAMLVSTVLALSVATIAGSLVAGLGDLQNNDMHRYSVLGIAFALSLFAWWQTAIPIGAIWVSALVLFCALLSAANPTLDDEYRYLALCIPLGLILAVPGFDHALRSKENLNTALCWSFFSKFVTLIVFTLAVIAYANLDVDVPYGLAGLVLAAVSAYAGLLIAKQGEDGNGLLRPSAFYIAGAAAYAVFAIHLLLTPAWTGIALAIIAAALAYAKLRDSHPLVPWLVPAFAIATMARFAIDPSVVGYETLSATPVLNWLLAGYGIPALAFAWAAYSLASIKDRMPSLIMQGIAVTATLAGAAVLVRHGMNNGVLSSDGPLTLAEHSLYTILAFGASATLIRLDQRNPSPIFNIGSMIIGYIGMASALFHHFLPLNPLFSDEFIGRWPIFNLSTMAYLVPAILVSWIWRSAIGKRPAHYIWSLSGTTFIFLCGWLVLTLRHAFHGGVVGLDSLDANGVARGLDYGVELLLYLPLFVAAAAVTWVFKRNVYVDHLAKLSPWFLGLALVIFAGVHMVYGNPFIRYLQTGPSHLFNLIGLGFAVPAALFGAWAWFSRHQSGEVERTMRWATGISSGIAAFSWLNLTIRHFYHGQQVSFYVPLSQAENYTFSVAWLVTGVAILAAGVKLRSRPLRMLSAALVVLTVLKVFIFDMSSLEGVLRAFSFMGLGLSLIGIGLFYQRVLTKSPLEGK